MVTSDVFSTPVYEFSSHEYKIGLRCTLKSLSVYYKFMLMLIEAFYPASRYFDYFLYINNLKKRRS